MNISVLTLTWNGIDNLIKVADSLVQIAHNFNGDLHWYIRDNGSKDGTVDRISEMGDGGTFITTYDIGHNRDSFAKCVNFLFKEANPQDDDLILLLNNDIIFNDTESLNNMVKLMTSDVGVVGARLLYPGGQVLQHAGVIFGPRYGNMPYHYRHKESNDKYSERNRYFQAVTAACCLVRAGDFKAIGGMDEGFRWSFEDIDMCLSIGHKLGKKIVYCGKTDITHIESATLVKNPVNKMFMGRNVQLFKSKWVGKYQIDHDWYLKDPHYNEIK
jgi:O-antigen biosynthesis protein